MKLKVFTAFSGYDSQCMALDRLGIDYELVGWSEIDKFAIQAHNAVYPQWADRNFGDISKIDWNEVPDFDLFTYSFPCTDISNAGQQKGLEKGSGTRSSLLWECQKAIEIKRPKYCLMENVATLVSKKFKPYFLEWVQLMCGYGYFNSSKILDSKNYGTPQHRERVFMVSIKGDKEGFSWPKKAENTRELKSFFESNVNESFYQSKDKLSYLIIGEMGDVLKIRQATKKGFIEVLPGSLFDASFPKSKTRRGRVQDGGQTSPTLTAGGESPCLYEEGSFRIRYLTPKECFRLMDVCDSDIQKIQESGLSNRQQLKMAGNSIVVEVLVQIFRKMFVVTGQESQQLSFF